MSMYDVVVIGGGHAGVEAAAAAHRMGARVALVTRKRDDVGVMSCNPAIGGVGKGHLVCECDALDGLMGRAIDEAGIQFRTLNKSRGAAVWGPRAQADRTLYAQAVRAMLQDETSITLLEDEVVDIQVTRHKKPSQWQLQGVILAHGGFVAARTAILTTGTFLRGVIRIGDWSRSAGRMGDDATMHLSHKLQSLGLTLGRLKTGTPPRLDGTTIHKEKTSRQYGDENPLFFSACTRKMRQRQIQCFVTHTNDRTHDIIRHAQKNPHRDEKGELVTGPRYCPSLEEKVVRFPQQSSHTIFLEPEGLNDSTIYPNGLSMSVSEKTQKTVIHSITGLEDARIVRYGYSVSYDYVRGCHVNHRLGVRVVAGLYLAGQINGSTGYEEAAAQGLVAGINAAHEAGGGAPEDGFMPSRATAYMGVMIDDLIRHDLTEPYRMLTARAEYRLRLRCDNAMQRLTPHGIRLNCLSKKRIALWRQMERNDEEARAYLHGHRLSASVLREHGVAVPRDGVLPTLAEAVFHETISMKDLARHYPHLPTLCSDAVRRASIEWFYDPYVKRHESQLALLHKESHTSLDEELNYDDVHGLSHEAASALKRARPTDLAAASRLEGVTPAALIALLRHTRHVSRETSPAASC